METANQPIKDITSDYYIDVEAIVKFFAESDHTNEWDYFHRIILSDTEVKEKPDPKWNFSDPEFVTCITKWVIEAKHQLCTIRDCRIKNGKLQGACEEVRNLFLLVQDDMNGEPLQVSHLVVIMDNFFE